MCSSEHTVRRTSSSKDMVTDLLTEEPMATLISTKETDQGDRPTQTDCLSQLQTLYAALSAC